MANNEQKSCCLIAETGVSSSKVIWLHHLLVLDGIIEEVIASIAFDVLGATALTQRGRFGRDKI